MSNRSRTPLQVSIQISLNGQQYSPHSQQFMYYATPLTVSTVHPPLGPKSGGTPSSPPRNSSLDVDS